MAPKPPTAVRVLAEVAADDLGVVSNDRIILRGTTTVGSDIAASPVLMRSKQRWCDGRGTISSPGTSALANREPDVFGRQPNIDTCM